MRNDAAPRFDVHVHVHWDPPPLHPELEEIKRLLQTIITKEDKTMALIDDILVDVADETTAIGSLEQVIQNMIAAAGNDPVKLKAIQDAVRANRDRVLADVVANTPQAPPPNP